MALTFNNVIYDEAGLPDINTDPVGTTDSNVASLSGALTTKISGLGLSSQYYTGANAVTQFAEVTNFITDPNGAAATNFVLASDANGTGFSTTDGAGVATGLYVGGVQVYLYGTSSGDVIVGRIGNSTSGKIAMIIAFDETKDGTGHVTGTDLGIEMLAPLTNSGTNLVDDDDITSMLSSKLFIYETHSTTTIVPFNDFSHVPSGQDLFALIAPSDNSIGADLLATGFAGSTEGTVNVSTQGLGANAQTVDNGASLRIDIVNANAGDFAKADTSPEVHDANNISYQNHVEAIAGGFELTQANPTNKLASLTISAYDGAADNKGASFINNVFSDGSSLVRIDPTKVQVTDGSGNAISGVSITQSTDGKSVLITGVPGLAHIDFLGDAQFNRFVVTNTMTSNSDKTTFDVGGIHVSTITGGTGHDSGDLGPSLKFEDGGPSFGANGTTIPNVQVDETTLGAAGKSAAIDFSTLFDPHFGPDGAAASSSLTYALSLASTTGVDSGLKDTASGNEIFLFMQGSDVVGRVGSSTTTANSGGQIDFRISVSSDGKVTFEQDYAVIHPSPTTVNEAVQMSAGTVVTLTATATDGDGDSANSAGLNIAGAFTILDDEPHSLGAGTNVTVGNTTSATDPDGAGPLLAGVSSGSFANAVNAGNDGFAAVGGFKLMSYTPASGGNPAAVSGPDTSGDYTWAYKVTGGVTDYSTIIESYKGTALFDLHLNSTGGVYDGTYTVTMDSALPSKSLDLGSTIIKAGGPTGSIDVLTTNDDNAYVNISGMTNTTFDSTAHTLTGTGGAVNASNGNVGVNNGNLDSGEVLGFQLFSSTGTQIPFFGLSMSTKTAQSSSYELYGLLSSDHTTVIDLGPAPTTGTFAKDGTITYSGNVLLDEIFVKDTTGNAIKVGLAGIHLLVPPGDAGFHYAAQVTDGDGDTVYSPFDVFIDGNNNGTIDSSLTYPA